ncbi:MAG: Com family DNA-binding transcriptional regulator [Desulfobacteraceae bacterium]|nr:Com family DNA-binding transcriptional regulator [Desulfobacteraceae bacterium]
MEKICQKCSKEFLDLYEDICHQCWNVINNDSITKGKELKAYRCPNCDKLLFKGHVSSLTMICPRCNNFVSMHFS